MKAELDVLVRVCDLDVCRSYASNNVEPCRNTHSLETEQGRSIYAPSRLVRRVVRK